MSLWFLFYKNTFLWYHSFGYFLFVFLIQCFLHFDVFCNNQHFSIVKIYMSNFHFVPFSIYLIWTRCFFCLWSFFFHFTLNHCNFSGFLTPLCLRHDDWPLSLQILFFYSLYWIKSRQTLEMAQKVVNNQNEREKSEINRNLIS